MSRSSFDNRFHERVRWNRKYLEAADKETWTTPDAFLLRAFSRHILPVFPRGGKALDLAGGAGRHSIWLARQGWEVTLIDISEAGVEQARQNAGPFASHIDSVVDDLTGFKASQTQLDAAFDLVLAFFYLDRGIFPEILNAIRPGGVLIYKTHIRTDINADVKVHGETGAADARLAGGPKNPSYLLEPGDALRPCLEDAR
jgi:tellurite methyltransferase